MSAPAPPPGAYYDQRLERFVLPHEIEWSAERSGQQIPSCPCGSSADLVVFTAVQPVTAKARDAAGEERSNVTGLCLGCAQKTGMMYQETYGG